MKNKNYKNNKSNKISKAIFLNIRTTGKVFFKIVSKNKTGEGILNSAAKEIHSSKVKPSHNLDKPSPEKEIKEMLSSVPKNKLEKAIYYFYNESGVISDIFREIEAEWFRPQIQKEIKRQLGTSSMLKLISDLGKNGSKTPSKEEIADKMFIVWQAEIIKNKSASLIKVIAKNIGLAEDIDLVRKIYDKTIGSFSQSLEESITQEYKGMFELESLDLISKALIS